MTTKGGVNIQHSVRVIHQHFGEIVMNKDKIDGAAKQAVGAVKEATGKVFGDSHLVAVGKVEKADGKLQSAIGTAKDALKK